MNIKKISSANINPPIWPESQNLPKPFPEPADHFHLKKFQFKYTASGSGKPNTHFLRKYVPPTE